MSRRPPKSEAGTWIALLGVFFGAALLMGLVAMVMPNFLGVIGIVFAIGFFGAFHYLTWGRWLMRRRQMMTDDEEE